MAEDKIPDDVRRFVFEYIDSVEQLEIFLLLCSSSPKKWSLQSISTELRTSVNAVEQRLNLLANIGVIKEGQNPDLVFFYHPENAQAYELVKKVGESYKNYRHSMYELIFSPLKKARSFAAAFVVKKDGSDNG